MCGVYDEHRHFAQACLAEGIAKRAVRGMPTIDGPSYGATRLRARDCGPVLLPTYGLLRWNAKDGTWPRMRYTARMAPMLLSPTPLGVWW